MAAEDLHLGRVSRTSWPARRTCAASARFPIIRWCSRRLHDCLHEAMDVEGLMALLQSIETGDDAVLARDLPHPSPLAAEILGARPYAYLDDAPLEERRTQAVAARRWLDPQSAAEFGQARSGGDRRRCARRPGRPSRTPTNCTTR